MSASGSRMDDGSAVTSGSGQRADGASRATFSDDLAALADAFHAEFEQELRDDAELVERRAAGREPHYSDDLLEREHDRIEEARWQGATDEYLAHMGRGW